MNLSNPKGYVADSPNLKGFVANLPNLFYKERQMAINRSQMVIFYEKAGNPSFSNLEARLTPESLNNGFEPFKVKNNFATIDLGRKK